MKKYLFFCYIIFLILFILLKFDGSFDRIRILHQTIINSNNIEINFVLLKTIKPYVKHILDGYAFINIFGNIISFILMGYFVSLFKQGKVIKSLIILLLITLIIEGCQIIFSIVFFDVDDILLKIIGCVCGIAITKIANT
ncbi:VanZ family protein [Lachnospiraceae bacterium ZAX-1]